MRSLAQAPELSGDGSRIVQAVGAGPAGEVRLGEPAVEKLGDRVGFDPVGQLEVGPPAFGSIVRIDDAGCRRDEQEPRDLVRAADGDLEGEASPERVPGPHAHPIGSQRFGGGVPRPGWWDVEQVNPGNADGSFFPGGGALGEPGHEESIGHGSGR